jgi:asparagine synthase (glutamine-hydrolysing)
MPVGLDHAASSLPSPGGLSARAALEQEVLSALRRPPCVVPFSGGRDSSAILALATAVARREGLPEPIAVTWRFPSVPSTDESDWQELVIEHLRVPDWERSSFGDELELLGDVATAGLLAHGLLWPPTVHLHVPALERARGGSLLTGWDGDGALGEWRFARAWAVLRGRERPGPRDVLHVALVLSPGPVRRRVRRGLRDVAADFPWLHPHARRELVRRYAAVPSPVRFDRWAATYARRRYLRVARLSLEALAARRDVAVHHPFASGAFLAAFAREGSATGLGTSRAAVMRHLFGDVLPEALIGRRTKAELTGALWGERSRAFAAAWDGSGVDGELVDVDRLRDQWRAENPLFGSGLLLQAAWLASRGTKLAS